MADTQLKSGDHAMNRNVADVRTPGIGTKVQLKRQMAELSYDEQVALVQPPESASSTFAAIQMSADPVQMGKGKGSGGKSKVPRTLKSMRTWMVKEFPILKDYEKKDSEKIKDPELEPLLKKLEGFAAEAETRREKKKGIPKSLKEAATSAMFAALKISKEKDPKQTKDLRGVYDKMGEEVLPKWQKQLEEDEVPKKERAQLANMHRNGFKAIVRDFQGELNLVRIMQLRNVVCYGDQLGPSFNQLFMKNKLAGMSDDANFDAIIASAGRPNKKFSEEAKK